MTPQNAPREFHLLLVEDNAADVRLIQEAFKEARHPVRMSVASNGDDAWERIVEARTDAPVDLVLLDFRLPRKSGRELLIEMKRHPELRRIPVIVLSTSNQDDDVRLSYDLYANCYVEKPKGLEERFDLVRAIEDFWFSRVRLAPVR